MKYEFHEKSEKLFFFVYQGFLHKHIRFTGQQGKGEDHLFFHSTTSTRLRTMRHLFATLHVRWLSHIFNRNACVYQTATRWDLPPYRITIWVIDWWCNVCLFTWWIDTRFCYSDLTLETGEFEPTSTITFVLQTKQLTKCASHPSSITLVLQANLLTKSVDKGKAMNRYQATRRYKK